MQYRWLCSPEQAIKFVAIFGTLRESLIPELKESGLAEHSTIIRKLRRMEEDCRFILRGLAPENEDIEERVSQWMGGHMVVIKRPNAVQKCESCAKRRVLVNGLCRECRSGEPEHGPSVAPCAESAPEAQHGADTTGHRTLHIVGPPIRLLCGHDVSGSVTICDNDYGPTPILCPECGAWDNLYDAAGRAERQKDSL